MVLCLASDDHPPKPCGPTISGQAQSGATGSGFKPAAAGSELVLDAFWQAACFSGEIEDGVAAADLPRLCIAGFQACAIEANLFRSADPASPTGD